MCSFCVFFYFITTANFQAVARHSCMELLNVYEEDLKSACINNEDLVMKSKIRRLDKINKLLAHRPWAIKGNHIKVHILQVNHFQIVFFVHHFTGYSFWDRLRNFLHIFAWIVLSVHKLNKLGKFWQIYAEYHVKLWLIWEKSLRGSHNY